MRHYFPSVPGLGNVAISRHAQDRIIEENITDICFEDVLQTGQDTPDGLEIIIREKNNIRLVIILKPIPFRGAKLVKTVYRVKP